MGPTTDGLLLGLARTCRSIADRVADIQSTGGGAAIGTVINGALAKIGKMLVEKGVRLLEPVGPSAQAYLGVVITKLVQIVEAASRYIGSFPF